MICPLEELVNSADFESAAKASTFESLGGSFWVDGTVGGVHRSVKPKV